jgi:serine O-acetyltransferase
MTSPLNTKLNRLTESILRSYDSDERTQRVGKMMQPSRSAIVDVLDLIRQLVLPGYFGQKKLTRQNIRYHVGNLLVNLGEKLADQIYHCMCMAQACGGCTHGEQCRKQAQTMAGKFLQRVPKIRDALALDAQAAYDGDPAAKSTDEVIYCYPGFYAVTVYRVAHELLRLGVPLMPRIMTEHAHSLTGTDIHPGATIGKSFFIDHATGVVIGETTTIGNNVKIYQGVTLGALSFPKDERGRVIKGHKRHPTLKDNVTVYANATILGGDTVIARGVTVGGNTFVTHSVNAESLVAVEAPKLNIKRKRRKK